MPLTKWTRGVRDVYELDVQICMPVQPPTAAMTTNTLFVWVKSSANRVLSSRWRAVHATLAQGKGARCCWLETRRLRIISWSARAKQSLLAALTNPEQATNLIRSHAAQISSYVSPASFLPIVIIDEQINSTNNCQLTTRLTIGQQVGSVGPTLVQSA